MILSLLPLFATDWRATFTAIFVLLPIYMLHQYESAGSGWGFRFRRSLCVCGDESLPLPGLSPVRPPP
jgi:hypothetical protein